jgi:hypothetical protein
MRRSPVWSLCLAAVLAAPLAGAEEPKKRELPDYDGRGGAPQTPGQKALWVPRILLSPLYFVSEFVIRRPLGFAITAAEKAELPAALYDFFAFGPDHKAGIIPIGFVDFGFEPSVGLYAFWDDAGFKGHQLRMHGSTWGVHWLSGTATERFVLSERVDFTLTATATRRPDYAFYGIGPDTREPDLMRYRGDSVDAHGEVRLGFWHSSSLRPRSAIAELPTATASTTKNCAAATTTSRRLTTRRRQAASPIPQDFRTATARRSPGAG